MRVHPQTLAQCTWPVLLLVAVGLLGGLHPSDHLRDVVVGTAGMIVFYLHVPALVTALSPGPGRRRALLWIGVRFAIAVAILVCIRGISHERTDWDAKDAWRRCGADASWPDAADARCRALHMCLHEAPMNDAELRGLIESTPGCAPP